MVNRESPIAGTSRAKIWIYPFCVLLGLLVLFFGLAWLEGGNWLRPFLEARLSGAIGRKVTIERLEVQLGRLTTLVGFGISVANPPGFQGTDFMIADRISVDVNFWSWLRAKRVARAELDRPVLNILQNETGRGNWLPPRGEDQLEIGELIIHDGTAHVTSLAKNADISASLSSGIEGLKVTGEGTYSGQPVKFRGSAGSLPTLNDNAEPYPLDFQATVGKTSIAFKGSIHDPFAMTSADLNLTLSGPDLSLLNPVMEVAMPQSPPYDLTGNLHYSDDAIVLTSIKGKVGGTDLQGELRTNPRSKPALITAAFTSQKVQLQDLVVLFASAPGPKQTSRPTGKQTESPDLHITFRGDKVVSRDFLIDTISFTMDKDGGHTRISPVQLGVDGGLLIAALNIVPADDNELTADADIKVEHVDVSKLLRPFGFGRDEDGFISGTARIKARGTDIRTLIASADGDVRASMPSGGYISSELINLVGADAGRALFDELGFAERERITCFIADFALEKGVLVSRELELDTADHLVTGGGRIDLDREVMAITIRADPKHFTVGSLASPIIISGPFKHLRVEATKELAERGGFVAVLGALFPPAALLPTIRFGVSDHSPCSERKAR